MSTLFCYLSETDIITNDVTSNYNVFSASMSMEHQQENNQQITIDFNHYHHLNQTIKSLSHQISTLQSSNKALTKTISTLITTINANNFSTIINKLNSVANTLNCISTSNTNQQQITCYFPIKPSISSSVPSTSTKNTPFRVKSNTVSTFVENEGYNIFSIKQHKAPTNLHPNNVIKYKLQCIICTKYNNKQDSRCKYVGGEIISKKQLHSISYLKSIKKGIEKHINLSNTHLSSVSLSQTLLKPSQALYIKLETVYFMIKRTLPWIVFEEIMVFLQRLIDYFGCGGHGYCLDIGEKQHSVKEARRIVAVFHAVVQSQTISIIQTQSYPQSHYDIIFFSISIDGWSRS